MRFSSISHNLVKHLHLPTKSPSWGMTNPLFLVYTIFVLLGINPRKKGLIMNDKGRVSELPAHYQDEENVKIMGIAEK